MSQRSYSSPCSVKRGPRTPIPEPTRRSCQGTPPPMKPSFSEELRNECNPQGAKGCSLFGGDAPFSIEPLPIGLLHFFYDIIFLYLFRIGAVVGAGGPGEQPAAHRPHAGLKKPGRTGGPGPTKSSAMHHPLVALPPASPYPSDFRTANEYSFAVRKWAPGAA
jgi:hypothetical protein